MWTDSWKPESYYDKIAANLDRGLHTLCLLGRKVQTIFVFAKKHNASQKDRKFDPTTVIPWTKN